jgi:hypothetical protein
MKEREGRTRATYAGERYGKRQEVEVIPAEAVSILPLQPEPLTSWGDAFDLRNYLYVLAEPTFLVGERAMPDDSGEACIVTQHVTDDEGIRHMRRTVVHNTNLYETDGIEEIPPTAELILYHAGQYWNSGVRQFEEYADKFEDHAAEDLEALVRIADPIVIETQEEQTEEGRRTLTGKLHSFLEDANFGLVAKYAIAWNASYTLVLERSAFFSLPHVLESSVELDCSILLASQKYYKQALQVLRNFLEGLIIQLEFCNDQAAFSRWKSGQYRTPPLRGKGGLLKALVSNGILPAELAEVAADLYGELNGSIHNAERSLIHKGIFDGRKTGRFFRYDRFEEWCKYFSRAVDLGIQVLRTNVNQWEALRSQGVLCRTCHSVSGFAVVERIHTAARDFTMIECESCHYTMTFTAEWAAKQGYV